RIVFRNTSDESTPWHIKNVTVRPIPGTRVDAGNLAILGPLNIKGRGSSEEYPGYEFWHPSRKFSTGHFGFNITNTGTHGIYLNCQDGGTIDFEGFEVKHGFSGVRTNAWEKTITVNGTRFRNFYVHDTDTGEGFYL